jgi:hypothetical protein
MKIENKSIFHDNEIKKIIDFVMPGLVREVFEYHRAKVKKKKLTLTIKVRTGNGFTGQMDKDEHGRYYLYLQVASLQNKFPFRESKDQDTNHRSPELRYWVMEGNGTKDYPTLFLSREEALVHTAAHELRHVWQHMASFMWDKLPLEETQGKPHSGVGSDYDADRYAIRKQREWRRLHNRPVYGNIAYAAGATITMANSEFTNRSNESKFDQLHLRVDPNHGK